MLLARGLTHGRDAIAGELQVERGSGWPPARRRRSCASTACADRVAARRRTRTAARAGDYPTRRAAQRERLALPELPTTTIGSFPQTAELRRARADLRAGRLDEAGYRSAMRDEIRAVVQTQIDLGLDVVVHGEPERNDMVQYFAEQLTGFVATDARLGAVVRHPVRAAADHRRRRGPADGR